MEGTDRVISRIATIVACLACISCTKIKSDELAGRYHAEPSKFGELLLSANGTYIYSYAENGNEVKNEGKWEVDEKDGEKQLSFSDFGWPSFFSSGPKGFWVVTPAKKLKGIVLTIDSDQGAYFVK